MFFLANKEIQMWDTEKKVKERNLNRKQKINTPNILCYPIFGEIRVDFVNSLMLRLKKKNKCLRWYCTQYKCAKLNRWHMNVLLLFVTVFFFVSRFLSIAIFQRSKKKKNFFLTLMTVVFRGICRESESESERQWTRLVPHTQSYQTAKVRANYIFTGGEPIFDICELTFSRFRQPLSIQLDSTRLNSSRLCCTLISMCVIYELHCNRMVFFFFFFSVMFCVLACLPACPMSDVHIACRANSWHNVDTAARSLYTVFR